jgi:DNA-binding MarR family transcriptional regulator
MQNQDLSIEAKAIYAYLCSFMGAGDTAFPSVRKICYDLGINVKRYYRHIDKLIELGFIAKKRTYYKASGKWANNTYCINYEVEGVGEEKVAYRN